LVVIFVDLSEIVLYDVTFVFNEGVIFVLLLGETAVTLSPFLFLSVLESSSVASEFSPLDFNIPGWDISLKFFFFLLFDDEI
jgi:hypothetical protein